MVAQPGLCQAWSETTKTEFLASRLIYEQKAIFNLFFLPLISVITDDCAKDQFSCRDGYCISLSLKCNGNYDCADKSDEANCTTVEQPCGDPTLKFQCDNKNCIAEDLICNGQDDCGDGSDEPTNCCML